jgi:hypothetical protein
MIEKSSYLSILSNVLITILMGFVFVYALYFIYKSYQQSFKESKIDKLLAENKEIQQNANYLDNVIRSETELNQRFYVQSNLIEQIISSEDTTKDFRNQLREFLDNFVMVTASINSFRKSRSRVRIIIWKQENDSEIYSYVNSSNFSSKKTHVLEINNSIVGRALRTQNLQKVTSTHDDPEWNEKTKKKYTAVLAFPIIKQYDQGNFVISFDFVNTDDEFVSYLIRNAVLIEQLLNKILFFDTVQSLKKDIENPFLNLDNDGFINLDDDDDLTF